MSFDQSFFAGLKQKADSLVSRADADAATAASIAADLMPAQRQVLFDPYERKAVLCPRRSGKSYCALGCAFHTALLQPNALIALITLTAGSAQRIYWKVLTQYAKRYGIALEVNNTNLTATLENGSTIFLVGAATRAEIEKLRGQSYDLAIIDECKSFSASVLEELIEEILAPATDDSGGTIMMIGTPGNVLAGPFYEATFKGYRRKNAETDEAYPISRTFIAPEAYWDTTEHMPEWSFHFWSLRDNDRVKDKQGRTPWDNALLEKKRKRWADDNPKWRRERLGEWATSDDVLVYAFGAILAADGETNCRAVFHPVKGSTHDKWGLPLDEEWRYVLGVDYGFEDDTAIVVLAYSSTHDTLYQVYDFKQKHLTASQAGEKLLEVQKLFDNRIEVMVADGGKQMTVDLNERYGLGMVPAEKLHKNDHVELLNSDLYDGKFKVQRDSELAHEWLHLQWDLDSMSKEEAIRRNKLTEDKRCANHLSDAALYAHHYCNHYFSREKHRGTVEGSAEWQREQRNKAIEQISARRKRERSGWADLDDFRAELRAERAEQEYEDLRDQFFRN